MFLDPDSIDIVVAKPLSSILTSRHLLLSILQSIAVDRISIELTIIIRFRELISSSMLDSSLLQGTRAHTSTLGSALVYEMQFLCAKFG